MSSVTGASGIGGDYRQWRTVVLSFAAGAASMSLFFYTRERRRKRRFPNHSTASISPDSNEQDDHNGLPFLRKSSSFIGTVRQSVEEAVARIGELPGRRSHWPWETIHRGAAQKKKTTFSEHDPTIKLTPPKKLRENPELCIGSIFGMDVGGTLAKLVYFEQRPDYDTDRCTFVSMREKHYHMAASAQAVLKARRGHDPGDAKSLSSLPPTPTPLPSNAISSGNEDLRRSPSKTKGLLRPRLSSWSTLNQPAPQLDENEKGASDNDNNSHTKVPKVPIIHTADSDDDLQNLYLLRPESVPDDLSHFADCVHYNNFLDDSEHLRRDSLRKHIRANSIDHSSSTSSIANLANAAVTSMTDDKNNRTDSSTGGMKKSRSMFDMSISQKSRDHAEALDRFYHFARKLDSYRGGVKDHKLSFYSRVLGGEFHFIRFETRRMEHAMELIRANDLHLTIREMGATGGGAHKYANDWDRILGIQMKKQEELASLVAGMQFVLSTVVGECYTFRPRKPKKTPGDEPSTGAHVSTPSSVSSSADTSANGLEREKKVPSPFSSDESDIESEEEHDPVKMDLWNWSRKVQRDAISYSSTYPYLLVTIGTGVSMLRVDGPRKHERISGSTIGGGTYWGLVRLLTDVEDFEDVMRLAEHGDPTKVDMMVGDIYGNNPEALEKLGLPAGLVASSFGKLVAKEDPAAGLTQEDLARALLLMVTNNIGQVAYLNAQLHKTSRIYFVGNFLRGNKLSQRRLSYAIDYWSKGEMEALFLEHEGYFGALGAFLLSQNISHDDLGPRRNHRNDSQNSRNHRRSHTLEERPLI